MAVSKHHNTEAIAQLFELGHRYFGENYGQELSKKSQELAHLPIIWSYIGQLQSNKIKKIVTHAHEIQTLASFKHAALIGKEATLQGKTPYPVYISVNCENEATKGGIPLDQVQQFAAKIQADFPELQLKGIMAIPPAKYNDNCQNVPELYLRLRELANQVGEGLLSLGMTGDLAIALKAGSNIVRIGTAIFGQRL